MFETFTYQSSIGTATITTDLFCTSDEEYMIPVDGVYNVSGVGLHRYYATRPTEGWRERELKARGKTFNPQDTYLRMANYVDSDGCFQSITATGHTTDLYEDGYWSQAKIPAFDWVTSPYISQNGYTFTCNVPFFGSDSTHALEYCRCTDKQQAINLLKNYSYNFKEDETEPEGKEFTINNVWTHGTWDGYGVHNLGSQNFRQVRGKIEEGGVVSIYKVDGIVDGMLKYGITIKSGTNFIGLQYSEDGGTVWHDTDSFPYEYFYRPRVNEYGTFDFGLTFYSQFPVWNSKEDSDDYIDGEKDISEADNWNQISPNYPPNNPTGIGENETEFGEVSSRAMFSQLYLCNVGSLYEISNALFDYDVTTLSGLWDDIKKGLEMYGTNPMEVVQGLRYYPFDLSQYFTSVQNQSYIYFGAYQLSLQNDVKKIIYANGYIDLGTIPKISRWYKDWRDFEPYTKISIYLPYIGVFPLDAKKYYDKSVKIRYYIDLRTGACTACLIANGLLLDYFDGIIGTEMPITLTDYSSYAQSQLNIIMRNAGIGIASEGTVGNIAAQGMGMALNYNENAQAVQEAALMSPSTSSLAAQTAGSYGTQAIAGAAIGGAALLGGVAVGTAAKTSFDLMRNGTAGYTKTRPASSAMINQYLPQYPYFRIEIMETDESAYLNELYGRPTNKGDVIGNFSGYLQAEDVMLICPIATDNERQEIIDLVKAGIYL